jgi:uncharacterized protein
MCLFWQLIYTAKSSFHEISVSDADISWYIFRMKRDAFAQRIKNAFEITPIVVLLGPRQCGKTTLARDYFRLHGANLREEQNYFDLEDPIALTKLENPKLALERLTGLIVIDEIQRAPNLFPLLRVLVDRNPSPSRFLILGSASRDLIRQGSESLAGRISFIELTPFDMGEVGAAHLNKLWFRGGFPRSFLAKNTSESCYWRKNYIEAFLERDIPNLGIQIPPQSLRRFWLMLTHYHGQIFNASEIGQSLGVAGTTVRRYLDILSGTFMVRQLLPWFENIGKRQIKSPKIFIRDSGILHSLLYFESETDLTSSPKLGGSWEGFALEECVRHLGLRGEEVFFWGTHQQAELDLLVFKGGKRTGYEVKYADTPKVTKSMRIAFKDLKLDAMKVIYPGNEVFPLDKNIEAIGLQSLTLSRL